MTHNSIYNTISHKQKYTFLHLSFVSSNRILKLFIVPWTSLEEIPPLIICAPILSTFFMSSVLKFLDNSPNT